MKKRLWILFPLLPNLFFVTGCNDDDDDGMATPGLDASTGADVATPSTDASSLLDGGQGDADPGSVSYLGAGGLGVSDLDKSLAFYQTVIGLSLQYSLPVPNYVNEDILYFKEDPNTRYSDVVIGNYTYTDTTRPKKYTNNPVKLVFHVPSLKTITDRIAGMGLAVSTAAAAPEFGGAMVARGVDIDGYTLELVEDTTITVPFLSAAGIGVTDLAKSTEFYTSIFHMRVKTASISVPNLWDEVELERLRATKDNLAALRMRSASNPGNRGHDWTKARFLIGQQPELLHREFPERFFLPARIEDNPHLRREEYVAALANLDPVRRKQLLDGDWEVMPSGNLFRREWFEIVDDWPREVSGVVRAWDDAATHGGGDWTVGVLMARARTGIFYVIDVVRIQGSPLEVEQLKKLVANTDADLTAGRAVILLQQEPGASGKSFIDAQRRGPLTGFFVIVENPSGDKYTRALPMSSAAEARNIKLVRGKWNRDFVEELEQARPDPKLYDHDDQWDAGASAFNHLGSRRSEFGWTSARELEFEEPFDPRFPEDDDNPHLRRIVRPELGRLKKGGRFGGNW